MVPRLGRAERVPEDRGRGPEGERVPRIGPEDVIGDGEELREDPLPDRPGEDGEAVRDVLGTSPVAPLERAHVLVEGSDGFGDGRHLPRTRRES